MCIDKQLINILDVYYFYELYIYIGVKEEDKNIEYFTYLRLRGEKSYRNIIKTINSIL